MSYVEHRRIAEPELLQLRAQPQCVQQRRRVIHRLQAAQVSQGQRLEVRAVLGHGDQPRPLVDPRQPRQRQPPQPGQNLQRRHVGVPHAPSPGAHTARLDAGPRARLQAGERGDEPGADQLQGFQ